MRATTRLIRPLQVSDVCDPEAIGLPFFEVGPDDDPGRCQRRCIEGIVGDCYSDCRDACEGHTLALNVCRRACRDASCTELQARCVQNENEERFTPYEVCCEQPGRDCLGEVDCKVTTTVTTTSTTSTTVATTTTTTVFGATTTTLLAATSSR